MNVFFFKNEIEHNLLTEKTDFFFIFFLFFRDTEFLCENCKRKRLKKNLGKRSSIILKTIKKIQKSDFRLVTNFFDF